MAIALVYHNDPTSSCYNDVRFAVFGMSHAGQESHWFGISDGRHIKTRDNSGIVRIMETPEEIPGTMGVGRNSSKSGTEPAVSYCNAFGNFAMAFDGYIINGEDLRAKHGGRNDGELATRFIADAGDFVKGIENLNEAVKGHFCVTVVTEKGEAYAARSRLGVRPLVYGEGERGQAIVSESRALKTIDMDIVRDIKAGEVVAVDGSGMHTLNPSDDLGSDMKVCSFLWPYYQMIDCVTEGIAVAVVKYRIGFHMGELAREVGIGIDVVTAVPDSGKGYQEGFARSYGCPHSEILVKDQYAGRSYDRPEQILRDLIAGVKQSAVPSRVMVKGDDDVWVPGRIGATEDSIRRGTQFIRPKGPVDLLKMAGAEEVHGIICSPRNTKYCRCSAPDGDRYKDEELAANRFPTDEAMAHYLDSSSEPRGRFKTVSFIEVDPFVDCITRDNELKWGNLCLGCYTGDFSFLE